MCAYAYWWQRRRRWGYRPPPHTLTHSHRRHRCRGRTCRRLNRISMLLWCDDHFSYTFVVLSWMRASICKPVCACSWCSWRAHVFIFFFYRSSLPQPHSSWCHGVRTAIGWAHSESVRWECRRRSHRLCVAVRALYSGFVCDIVKKQIHFLAKSTNFVRSFEWIVFGSSPQSRNNNNK